MQREYPPMVGDDECYSADGPLPYGRCDKCGQPDGYDHRCATVYTLAAAANAAADNYRHAVEKSSYSDVIAAANTLLHATEALATAVADENI